MGLIERQNVEGRGVSKTRSSAAWRQQHARYRLVPVELAPFETPTWLKAQDAADGVVELRSENSAGEILNTGRRFLQPLELWHRHGLPTHLYQAGKKYGAIWREACRPKSPPHSDPTRVVVDGQSEPPIVALIGRFGTDALAEAQKAIGDEETISFLNRLAGLEDWPPGDKRRFKRKCRNGLAALAMHWRRR